VVVEGPRPACQSLLDAIGSDRAPGFVGDVVHTWGDLDGEAAGFRVN
jgi:hypothetical protein